MVVFLRNLPSEGLKGTIASSCCRSAPWIVHELINLLLACCLKEFLFCVQQILVDAVAIARTAENAAKKDSTAGGPILDLPWSASKGRPGFGVLAGPEQAVAAPESLAPAAAVKGIDSSRIRLELKAPVPQKHGVTAWPANMGFGHHHQVLTQNLPSPCFCFQCPGASVCRCPP
jgi:hypothetical protein